MLKLNNRFLPQKLITCFVPLVNIAFRVIIIKLKLKKVTNNKLPCVILVTWHMTWYCLCIWLAFHVPSMVCNGCPLHSCCNAMGMGPSLFCELHFRVLQVRFPKYTALANLSRLFFPFLVWPKDLFSLKD